MHTDLLLRVIKSCCIIDVFIFSCLSLLFRSITMNHGYILSEAVKNEIFKYDSKLEKSAGKAM